MNTSPQTTYHLVTIDCCEHVLAALGLRSRITEATAKVGARSSSCAGRDRRVDLIVIGASKYPVRELFISHLRRVFPDPPVLLLQQVMSHDGRSEFVRGEFILSDNPRDEDLALVSALRLLMPLKPCSHARRGASYNLVEEVLRIIAEKYRDPELNLARVAEALPVSPVYLSRLLNQKVGVSFPTLLRHMRIEEAKHMLASRRYSVREVAERVGFSDSHYFSRSFKQLTGQSASEYRRQDVISG